MKLDMATGDDVHGGSIASHESIRTKIPRYDNIFLVHFASSPRIVTKHLPNSFLIGNGHQAATSLFSFPNTNLLPAGPHNTAIRSPSNNVLNTRGLWCFSIRS
ncbi:hypothetical protein Hdeb2414_s0059g00760071 [Helianthus debilis subsp. tardiflorus]